MKHSFDYDYTLTEAVSNSSQAHVARSIGVTNDAVRQMLLNKREIYFRIIDDQWEYLEVRPWRQRPTKRQVAA